MKKKTLVQAGLLGALLLVGCGGGGGGRHSGSSSSNGTGFSADSIVYGVANGTDADYKVVEMDPAGESQQTVFADVPGTILLFALNPSVSGRYVVAADPTGSGTYGIYVAKSLSLTNATALVSPAYAYVSSLAVTADGTHVVYTATTAAGVSSLYSLPIGGGVPTLLAASDGSTVSPADGDTIAYVAPANGVSGNDQVFTRSLAAGASGAATAITTDDANYALPAFSRDGTKLAFWRLATGANALFVDTLATGALATVPGVTALEPQGEAFNSTGTALTLVGESGTTGEILTAPVDGSAAPTSILSSSTLLGNYGIYWTDSAGRVVGGSMGMGAASRRLRR